MSLVKPRTDSRPAPHVFTRFALVGMLGTLVDFSLLFVLHTLLGVPTLIANTLAYSAGIVNNFVLHQRWTFAERVRREWLTQFPQFTLVSLSALMLNNLLVFSLSPSFEIVFDLAGYSVLFAKLCATGVGMVWNYLLNKWWTFRTASPELSRVVVSARQSPRR